MSDDMSCSDDADCGQLMAGRHVRQRLGTYSRLVLPSVVYVCMFPLGLCVCVCRVPAKCCVSDDGRVSLVRLLCGRPEQRVGRISGKRGSARVNVCSPVFSPPTKY